MSSQPGHGTTVGGHGCLPRSPKVSTQASRRRHLHVVKRQLLNEEDVGKVAGALVRTLLTQVLRTGVELSSSTSRWRRLIHSPATISWPPCAQCTIVLQIAHDFCRRTRTPAEGQRGLRLVEQGEVIEITDRGRPVAQLRPMPVGSPLEQMRAAGDIEPASADFDELPESRASRRRGSSIGRAHATAPERTLTMAATYLDSSAIVKLAVREPESDALRAPAAPPFSGGECPSAIRGSSVPPSLR